MRIDTNKTRIGDAAETPRERELRGKVDKLEIQIEELKKRLPPTPVPLEGTPHA